MDDAAQVVNQQAKFTLQWKGDAKPGVPVPLDVMLEAHRDDPDVLEWLQRPPTVGGSLITGGGAAPQCSIRRVE